MSIFTNAAKKGLLGGAVGQYAANKKVRSGVNSFLFGEPETIESNLLDEQQPGFNQQLASIQGPGAGGAFGTAADYYYNNLSNDPETMKQLSAPELRRFNEETIPGLSEQFAGMGSGALSSSGFRNAAVNAGTDLSERLGAIRAQLRENSAQGLQNLGQNSLQDRKVIRPGKPGLFSSLAPAIGTAAGTLIGGPAGGMAGNALGQGLSQGLNSFGSSKVGSNSNPYGSQGGFSSKLPNFNPNLRSF